MSQFETGNGAMVETLVDELAALQRERDRLEQFLMLDVNWRALRQLDEREAAGQPLEEIDGGELRATLVRSLAANRIYAAHAKIVEAIALLSGSVTAEPRPPQDVLTQLSALRRRPSSLSSRIVMLPDDMAPGAKARLEVKPVAPVPLPIGGAARNAPGPATVETINLPPAAAPMAQQLRAGIRSVSEIAATLGNAIAASGVPALPSLPPAAIAVPAHQETDRLDLIAGIDPKVIERLQAGGVASCKDIARWSAADAEYWRRQLADCCTAPISAWIEQAAILAAGTRTRHADRMLRGELDSVVPMPMALAPPVPPRVMPAGSSPVAVDAATTKPAAPARLTTPPPLPCAASTPHALPAEMPVRVIVIDADDPQLGDLQYDDGCEDAEVCARPSSARMPALPGAGSPTRQGDADNAGEIVVETRRLEPEPPVAMSAGAPDGSEFEVETPAAPTTGRHRLPAPPPRGSLLSRLRGSRASERFDGTSYAAYRGEVEEASVTIVRSEAPPEARPVSPSPPSPAPEDRPASVDRFLKALTGKP